MVLPAGDVLLITLAGPTDWRGFRQACRVLLAEGAEPDKVRWRWPEAGNCHIADTGVDLFSHNEDYTLTGRSITPDMLEQLAARHSSGVRLNPQQLRCLQSASLHSNPARFELLHRWLARVQATPRLRGDTLDPDWRNIEHMAKAVGRDIHKMHAFVRFRTVRRSALTKVTDSAVSAADTAADPAHLHLAWFEPEHHIVAAAASFFVKRFTQMHWAILTPRASLHWDGKQLELGPGAHRSQAPLADAGEALWLTYYASTFNPARLKEQAMLKEMPRKYWHNLPEASLISPLVQQARARTGRMLQQDGD